MNMKQTDRLLVMGAVAVALLITGAPLPAFSEMMDIPVKGRCAAHGQMMDMPMREQGAGPGQMMPMGHKDVMGGMMDMCIHHADMMGLTEDQIMKIKPVHREMQKQQARFRADLTIAKIDLREIMEVKDFDLAKASAAVKKIAEIKTARALEMLKTMREVRAILTDEQFKKMNILMMSMKMHGRDREMRMMK
jgi:Spy/CpxP family protein refolding chaperone